jgi:CheY-like chemotaxis protein
MEGPSNPDLDVLVVDDDLLVREVIVGNLAEKFPHFRFRQADSGNAALALINESLPDVILIDLRMPGLNGFALTRMLRSRDRTRHIPILIVSTLKDSTSVLKALELGANDYCVKPIDFQLLARKLELVCTQMLHHTNVRSKNRSMVRKMLSCEATAIMPVSFPEREGLWVNSPLDVSEGEPLLIDAARFFRALRLRPDTNYWWSRVEHCEQESDSYHLKLLFDPVPENYQEQLVILNRSRDRFRRYFGGGQEVLKLDFPCHIRDLSGGGLRVVGALPWRTGSVIHLDLSEMIRRLGFTASDSMVAATIRWSRKEGAQYLAGTRFEEIDDDLRLQIMTHCLGNSVERRVPT